MKLPSKSWKAILIVGAIACSLIGAVLLFDQRQVSQWVTVERELAAKGEILIWDAFVPDSIPDTENFYAAPIFEKLIGYKPTDPIKWQASVDETRAVAKTAREALLDRERRTTRPTFPPGYPRKVPYLLEYLRALPATANDGAPNLDELDRWLALWDEEFAELRAALDRPQAHLPGNYANPASVPLVNFVQMRNLTQLMATRARVHFLNGRIEAGVREIEAISGLVRALDTRPALLVNAAISGAMAVAQANVLHDLLGENLLREEDLVRCASALDQHDLIGMTQRALRQGERAAMLRYLDQLMNDRDNGRIRALAGPVAKPHGFLVKVAPNGWIRKNKAAYAMLMQNFIEVLDPQQRRFYPDKQAAALANRAATFANWSPHTAIAEVATPSLDKALVHAARNQTHVDHARIAIALARYKQKHQRYPAQLEELTPDFLRATPHDIASGQALIYSTDGSKFTLYSVGDDAVDNGGDPAKDWLWQLR